MNSTRFNEINPGGIKETAEYPVVAVVILNWNGRKYLEQFLPSVLASTYPGVKIIMADNDSSDDSVSFVQQQYPAVEIIINNSNEGFAKGYNSALKKVQADYYVLLNSDVEVSPGWIEPVVSLMQADRLIAACQPKLLSYHEKNKFEYAGASGGWLDKFGYPFMRGRIFDFCEEDTGQYDDIQACFWASGAALFVKAAVYHEMNGLDEYFFAHQEEIDLCWRIQLAGYKIFVQPASVVYHVGGGTLPRGNSRKVFLNFRNNLIMLAKNLETGSALWKIPFRLGLDAIAAWKGLLSGDGGFFTAILKAHLHFFKWILLDRRKSVFPRSKKGKPAGYLNESVIWAHFVKKLNRFSQIVNNK